MAFLQNPIQNIAISFGTVEMNLTSVHEDAGSIPGLPSVTGWGLGVAVRCSSDPDWLWLWHRLVAIALMQPLAWECPYAIGVALKKQKAKKKKKKRKAALDGNNP